jgi:hypothetical protein
VRRFAAAGVALVVLGAGGAWWWLSRPTAPAVDVPVMPPGSAPVQAPPSTAARPPLTLEPIAPEGTVPAARDAVASRAEGSGSERPAVTLTPPPPRLPGTSRPVPASIVEAAFKRYRDAAPDESRRPREIPITDLLPPEVVAATGLARSSTLVGFGPALATTKAAFDALFADLSRGSRQIVLIVSPPVGEDHSHVLPLTSE